MLFFGLNRGQHIRGALKSGGSEKMMPIRERTKSAPMLLLLDNIDTPGNGSRSSFSRNSTSDGNDIEGAFGTFGSIDITGQKFDFGTASSSPRHSSAKQSSVSANW